MSVTEVCAVCSLFAAEVDLSRSSWSGEPMSRVPASRSEACTCTVSVAQPLRLPASIGSVKTKRLPCPGLALDPDPAAVQFDEALRERQAEARPLGCSRPRSVCWNSSKIRSWSSGAMPGPVSVTEIWTSPSTWRDATTTLPPCGRELDRVREEVEDHLAERALVAVDQVDVGRGSSESRTPPLLARSRTITTPRSSASRSENGADLELDLPGLDLGQVEHVVDQRQRWLPDERMSSRYSSCFSLTSPKSRSRSTCEKPMIAFSGVRSSCDMFARNSVLCRLAPPARRTAVAARRSSG